MWAKCYGGRTWIKQCVNRPRKSRKMCEFNQKTRNLEKDRFTLRDRKSNCLFFFYLRFVVVEKNVNGPMRRRENLFVQSEVSYSSERLLLLRRLMKQTFLLFFFAHFVVLLAKNFLYGRCASFCFGWLFMREMR